MKSAPDFWWKPGQTLASWLLSPAGWIYGLVSGRRMLKKPKAKSRLPVICVGNFVVGGTGKTPFAIELSYRLQEEGLRPGFLLRGYGGKAKGPLLVDAGMHDADVVGDEALLLARYGPTVIAADRPSGARLAEQQPIDVLLMDDGFQNPALAKDLSLVLVDCSVGFGNGKCLPAGPLRAPAAKQIVKADCLVLVGEGDAAEEAVHLAGRKGLPILHAHVRPQPNDELAGSRLFAFAGIGRPQKFFDTLKSLGYDVKKTREFPDHHQYTQADVRALLTEAEEAGFKLVTTSKDMARLETSTGELFHWIASSAAVLEVRMEIDDEDRLASLIKERLRRRQFGK
ncbi:tetraacyldisaccharide 4'-kinase [Labrenzia sp. CP4]|jgi:tetraacyldisaccharide 4'-kinase|uniref:tetraacyldisaccharide 4'-kinase n=1 Tax=Stappiaceae TaxID=2821832 RepID=UPI0007848A09|nr:MULTISPECIES: tetraacyldisaccharide 4'-kinase [Stappiaceae]AMN54795.1 tetraacyldisaccharide 4'-kinase [Labrenzia sp. CP4]UES56400.1 tetraacyldisaccharide 4'-kinase [Roseibium aggregatum]